MSETLLRPLIGVPACVKEINDSPFHAVGDKYLRAIVEAAGAAGAVMLIDEAYHPFLPETALPWIEEYPHLVVARSTGKAWSMAGLRIGYAIAAPETAAAFNRVRNHFGVSRMAQIAALAALGDEAHLASVQAGVAGARIRIGEIAAASGLACLPSATNFVAIDCGEGGDFARRVLAGLLARDIFVRMPGTAPQDRCIRISAGRGRELDLLAAALPAGRAEAKR